MRESIDTQGFAVCWAVVGRAPWGSGYSVKQGRRKREYIVNGR